MSGTLVAADVRVVWDDIRPGLEHTRLKAGALWRPEDVYAACVSGAAALYVGEPGFVVVQRRVNALTGVPELLVWIAYSRAPGSIESFQPAVDALAREHGFSRLSMWSNRRGFERVPGWHKVASVFEREVPHE